MKAPVRSLHVQHDTPPSSAGVGVLIGTDKCSSARGTLDNMTTLIDCEGDRPRGADEGIRLRVQKLEADLSRLLNSRVIKFDDSCRSALPEAPGIYRIFDPAQPRETVRAGRTKTAAGGLRQRVYQNHLMGNQTGNLRAQLVAGGVCSDVGNAKRFIREHLAVQVFVVENPDERVWLERELGYEPPVLCTPEELSEEKPDA